MSENLPQQQPSEEIDLGQLFKMIGNFFDRIYRFFATIFNTLFSGLIYIAKTIIKHFKTIAIAMFLAAVAGFALQKTNPSVYVSQMLVKPYFDSKYQLVTNINYYNALIDDKDYNQLENIFKIDKEDAKKLIEFEIKPGPESENQRIQQYDEFLSSLDSLRAQNIDYETYKDNRSIYSGDFFEIHVSSYKKNIFRSLEEGLNSTFINTYSVKKMKKRDSLIQIEKARIINSLNEVDSLQKVYVKVLQEESSTNNRGPITMKDGFNLVQERVVTKEFELLTKQLELRQALSLLESQKVEEDVYFDTISSFQDVGSVYESFWDMYAIIFPMLTFILLCLFHLGHLFVKFVKSYED